MYGKGGQLKVIINGFETEIPEETTIMQLLDIINEPLKPDMIVEINGRFVHTKLYDSTILHSGDKAEAIHLDIGG